MTKDYEITTCGLNCDLCDSNTTKMQDSAKYLFKVFEDPMIQGVVLMFNPEFKKENFSGFVNTLDLLKDYPTCSGCQERMDCPINQCAKQKNINSCSECEFLDLEAGMCKAVPEQPKTPMMPPAPVFFQGLSKRYQNWNVKNLITLASGDKDKVNKKIGKMIKEGKTSRDILDISVNLFESRD
ncbi:MAG: DUF3795 domain-containing protein [Candidatus Lokiarchaeia archaeon]|nr:DUF3795 domain-containing protein [Candidatus Lokiarchaeia archaeon]